MLPKTSQMCPLQKIVAATICNTFSIEEAESREERKTIIISGSRREIAVVLERWAIRGHLRCRWAPTGPPSSPTTLVA